MSDRFLGNQYFNFRGLFDRDESGLIPSDPATGVFASSILNVRCDDGTISMTAGYEEENDGASLTTHVVTGTFIRNEYRLKRRDGTVIMLAQYDSGKLGWRNTVLNRYELLHSGLTAGVDVGICEFNKTDQDRTYLCDGVGDLKFWDKAVAFYASDNGSNSITVTVPNAAHTTLALAGFDAAGTLALFDGTQVTYTGLSTLTFTGCSTVPVSPVVGDGIAQAVDVSLTSKPIGRILFKYQARLGVVVEASPTIVRMSAVADGTDFASAAGVSGPITLNVIDGDGRINAAVPYKNRLIIMKEGGIIPVEIVQLDSSTLRTTILPLIDFPNVGPQAPGQVFPSTNELYWVSPLDKDIKTLSRISDQNEINLNSQSISTPIKNLLDDFTYTNSKLIIAQRQAFLTTKDTNNVDTVVQYDSDNQTFYVHQLPAFNFWFDENNVLHFTDPNAVKSYRAFSGYDADGGSISYLWKSGRLNMGTNFYKKEVNMFAIFGKMTTSSEFTYQLDYNAGSLSSVTGTVKGDGTSRDNGQYMLTVDPSSAYGTHPYGIKPYGGEISGVGDQYFLAFRPLPKSFRPYDLTVTFAAEGLGNYIKIISCGLNPTIRKEISRYRKLPPSNS